jgi:hypothetical protein
MESKFGGDSEGDKIEEERRYEMALAAGFKGSLKQFQDGINAKGDDAKLTALFAGAVAAGYRKGYLEFRKEYLLGRKA